MYLIKLRIAIVTAIVGFSLIGCDLKVQNGNGGINFTISGSNLKSAKEERRLATEHVPGSAIDVSTNVGSIEITADPSVKEVEVLAKLTAYAETEEDARSHLHEIEVKLDRESDGLLKIRCQSPKQQTGVQDACAFDIRVPDANGILVRTGNGSVTLQGLSGEANVETSVGSVTISDQAGNVTAHTGNGAIRLMKGAGEARFTTSVGSITIADVGGDVKTHTGNGAVHITAAKGDVDASSDVGAVTVQDAAAVKAKSGNGTVTVVQAKGRVHADTSVGQVKIEQAAGTVEAESGNGSIVLSPAAGSTSSFKLKTAVGSVTVRLPGSAAGRITAETSVGNITVNGSRTPHAVTGERSFKQIVLSEKGPASTIHSGNGSITITLD
jgi:DUF4097 and DUF4098 domain-containing protein YvlB